MAKINFLEWNMEWMNDLFVAGNGPAAFRPDDEKPQHNPNTTVRLRRDHLSGVLKDLAPDLVVVIEGPNRAAELDLFFQQDLPGTWQVDLQQTPGQAQTIGIAVRTDEGKFLNPAFTRVDTKEDSRFDPFLIDTDEDDLKEQHKFDRRPLLVKVSPAEGKPFHVLGLHLKSKGIFDAYEWSKWWQKADANRKKILAQAAEIRAKFIEPFLTEVGTAAEPLVVCGDINDGPGLDASEKRLFGSGIERLMGNVWKPNLCLGNALFDALKDKDREKLNFSAISTTSFKDPIFNNVFQREWIDHILYSRNQAGAWLTNAQVRTQMPDGSMIWSKYKHASDHYPVSVEVNT